MKYRFESRNMIAWFNELNQGAEELTWFWCTLFAPAINLKYNCGINLTLGDIKEIGEEQIALGLLKDKFGGKGSNGITAIYNYVIKHHKERGWKIPNLIEFNQYDNTRVMNWTDRGYMILLGIKVNRNYPRDVIDGELDLFNDYNKYKGDDLLHFTNITKWKDRFTGSQGPKYNQEQFIDSYSFNKKGNKWIYKCSIRKVLDSFDMHTKYCFY